MTVARAIVVAWIAVALAGCADRGATAPIAAKAPVTRERTMGPVELRVTVDDGAVTVGEPIAMTIEVVAETLVDVRMPRPGETLGEFEVIGSTRPPDIPEAGSRRWRHIWLLRTFESGELEIPPVTVAFTDRRDGAADAIEAELATDSILVVVASLVDEAMSQTPTGVVGVDPTQAELLALLETEPRETSGFVDVPRPFSPWPMIIAAGVHAVVAAAALAWVLIALVRNAGPVRVEPPVPAHEWARRELDALAAEDLTAVDRRHAYFFRLSGIVREYIERRFGLTAPEQTTPEFIAAMRRHPVLDGDQQQTLGSFLRSADLVKFALHDPPRDECETALATARTFVEETVPEVEATPESIPSAEAAA